MASVGQVFYDVLPNLDGFAAKVASGLGNAKPIKIPVEVDSAKAAASLKTVSTQTDKLGTSSARLAAAQGRVRVTAAQLNETRQKATAGSAKLVQAEERYASALRGVKTAHEQDAKVAARATAVRDKAAAQQIAQQNKVVAAQEKAAARSQQIAARDAAARKQTIQGVGTGLALAGAGTLAALGGIVKVTADFDSAVSNVASTGKDASASIGQLRQEAIKYGASTAFSATEAANAQAELIKANVSVTDTINGGLKGALDLAAAGSLDVASAAGIMGTAMSQFKLPGTDASHVADLLAAAAGKAQGEVGDFAEALKYVGPLAHSAGVGIEETTGVLAEFANQGILGSQAGTALRGIFLGLTAPVGAGAKAIEKYGINVRDASGEFIGMAGAAAELQRALKNKTRAERDSALAAIFGRNQVTAATILYEEGAKGVQDWTTAVSDSGFAARTAATKMDNLKGDVEQLKGAIDSAFISSGSGGTSFLRGLAQDATRAIDSFNNLNPAVQQFAFKGAAIAGVSLLAGGALIKLAGGITTATTGLVTLGAIAPATASKIGALTAAAGPAAAAFAAVAVGAAALDALGAQTKNVDDLQKSLTQIAQGQGDLNSVFSGANWADKLEAGLTGGVTPAENLSGALAGLDAAQNTTVGKLARWREFITPFDQSLESAEKQVGALDTALTAMVTKGQADQAATAIQNLGLSGKQVAQFLPQYSDALNQSGDAAARSFRASEIAFKNSSGVAQAIGKTGTAAVLTADEIAQLTEELYGYASASLALSGNAIAVEAAIDNTAAATKNYRQELIDKAKADGMGEAAAKKHADAVIESGKGLDINTQKGRDNQTALDNLVSSTLTATKAMDENGSSVASIAKVNERAKSSWIKNAIAMGHSSKEAHNLADGLFALPASVTSQIVVSGAKVSAREAKSLNTALKGIPKEQRARIVTIANTKGAKAAQVEIAKVKSKNVIAKATGKGVNTVKEIDGAIKKLKSKKVQADAKTAGKGAVTDLDRAIKKLKDRKVTASVTTSGTGALSNMQQRINAIHGKTVVVTTVHNVRKATAADGRYIEPVRRAAGGPIFGMGGPREDNIAGIDRNTGVQTSWVSAKEFVVNAVSTRDNRAQIELMNATPGRKWDLTPRLASGGSPDGKASKAWTSGGGRPLILNIDMGDMGIRRIVTEIVEDRDEYTASVGRMR